MLEGIENNGNLFVFGMQLAEKYKKNLLENLTW